MLSITHWLCGKINPLIAEVLMIRQQILYTLSKLYI
jgi:hypothetical protein